MWYLGRLGFSIADMMLRKGHIEAKHRITKEEAMCLFQSSMGDGGEGLGSQNPGG